MFFFMVAGILLGLLFPRGSLPWDDAWATKLPTLTTSVATQTTATTAVSTFNFGDNLPLIEAATQALRAIDEQDYTALSQLVDETRGVTFTPYSTVDTSCNLTFYPSDIAQWAGDTSLYTWGFEDGSGLPMSLTVEGYFQQFVMDADYTQAPQLAIDQVTISGNALENVTEAYPDCRFVEFSFPMRNPEYEGLDWCALKLVFAPGETDWALVGIIHSQWTI